MKRRALLSTIATGAAGVTALAGCSGESDTSSTTTTRTTAGPTTTDSGPPQTTERAPEPPETGLGGATTAVLETGDRTLSLLDGYRRLPSGLRVDAWLSQTATAKHPAEITATIRNPTRYQTAVQLNGVGPFSETPVAAPDRRHGADAGLYLVPTEDHEFATKAPAIGRDSGFWYLDDSPGDWHPPSLQLDPGEVAVGKLWVVTHYQYPGVLAPGRYRFGYSDDPLTIVAWQTSQPGPTERSRFEGADPPEFEEMSPAWFHDAGPESPVYLQPSTERAETPAQVEFTLHNYTTEPLTGNRYDWSLEKQVDGEWYHVEPWAIPVPLTPVPPGGTESWTLHAFSGKSVPCEDALDVGFLGGGRYAFQVNLHPKDGPTSAARFDLEGPDVEVTPTDGVQATGSGDTVAVSGPVTGDRQSGVLVVERADSADERLIAEQVMRRRNRGLRNTLSFFESGVTRVRLSTLEQVVDEAVGFDEPPRQFQFDGQAYVVRRGE